MGPQLGDLARVGSARWCQVPGEGNIHYQPVRLDEFWKWLVLLRQNGTFAVGFKRLVYFLSLKIPVFYRWILS